MVERTVSRSGGLGTEVAVMVLRLLVHPGAVWFWFCF